MISVIGVGAIHVGRLGEVARSGSLQTATRALLPLVFACGLQAQYVGSMVCAECHPKEAALQSRSAHALALAHAPADSPGEWAFGAGRKAITYVSRTDEDWYVEKGLSFYASKQGLAPTPGHSGAADLPYPALAPAASVARCFRCHSTGQLRLGEGFAIEPAENGVTCEACHGPGAAHVKAGGGAGTIGNPKRLNAVELNQFCGTCHRRPPEAGEVNDGRIGVGLKFDWSNSWNTRHQPAYLSQSACFRGSGGALSCLTCHDPHALAAAPASYDSRCLSCHADVKHRASVVGTACISCHMPSVPAGTEMRFTNHWIGVYAKGNPLVPLNTGQDLAPLVLPATAAGKIEPPNSPSTLLPLFEEAVARRQEQLGATNPKTARSEVTLGLFLKETGNPGAAEKPLRQALEIERSNRSADAPATAEELAQILLTTGRRQQAAELFRQAAAGADARVAAQSYANLAKLDPGNAAAYYAKAVAAEETASGKENPRVATQLSNLALALRAKGDLKTAEAMLRHALSIQDNAFGRDHYQTATTLSNLGTVLQGLGRFQDAQTMEREALSIFEQELPNSPELAAVCANLADLSIAVRDREGAAGYLRRAIAIDEAAGGESLELAADLARLGSLPGQGEHSAESGQLLRRALAIYEARLGSASPQARDIRAKLSAPK